MEITSVPAEARLFAGRVALVTGASHGIGAATARLLANLGAAAAVNYHHDYAAAVVMVRGIRAGGGRTVEGAPALATELGPSGVRVDTVAAGPALTRATQWAGDVVRPRWAARTPLGRNACSGDVADAIALSSPWPVLHRRLSAPPTVA